MPAIVQPIVFDASRNPAEGSFRLLGEKSKLIFFTAEIPTLPVVRQPAPKTRHHRQEDAGTLAMILVLHLAGLLFGMGSTHKTVETPPLSIQVSWLADPKPKVNTSPAPPPKRPKPAAKPKPKPAKRVKTPPKTVLSTAAQSAAVAVPFGKPNRAAVSAAAKTEGPAKATSPENPTTSLSSAANASASRQPQTQPSLNADYLSNPAPRYPEDARERGEQGKVLVRALIDSDGSVAELGLKRSSGYPSLDRSALDTVKKWRFVPARRGPAAVAAWVVVPISFTLEG
ncbi:MAG: energy transducer TonB [Gammaproteobacteria bacterium]